MHKVSMYSRANKYGSHIIKPYSCNSLFILKNVTSYAFTMIDIKSRMLAFIFVND